MRSATISELKKELQTLPSEKLLEICTRIVKYKKENKELLNYLLFEMQDEENFIRNIKAEVENQFADINSSTLYFAKKSIRKILRLINKYIKYSDHNTTTVEVLIHFCQQLNSSGIKFEKSTALLNLYNNQLKRINKTLALLHEDLQYDYQKELSQIKK